MISAEQIGDNLKDIEERITAACNRCGRSRRDVTLIAVSKLNPADAVAAAAAAGQYVFGENRVQELVSKQEEIVGICEKKLEWHLIGHLQTNKVKDVVGKVELIHSVDSFRLAQAIDKESLKKGMITDILLEINISSEETKFGLTPENTEETVRLISGLTNVRIKGLMTVAPYTENPESNRIYFKKLKDLSVDISSKNIDNISMGILSMGMTGDFEVAIEEGATHVRVGTGIFGARDYTKRFIYG
ncbi:MAG: YggS family pyridoxal phosphate-dependent enzyme [Lachnospiraceae bacterium]|nr:YggS family pyridoxal phosphate-dependent enzyme [Lachnospiraceae bacterium]